MTTELMRRRWHRVTDPAAAAFLVEDANRRYLRPFLEREASVSEAAENLGEPVENVYYRVKRMLDLGILEVTREVPRAGRPVKRYRSVGNGLFVPFSVTGAADLEESRRATNTELDARLVHGQTRAMREAHDTRATWGYRVYRDADDSTHFDYAPYDAPDDFDPQLLALQEDSPAVVSTWVQMPLPRQVAKELQREMIELVGRYRQRATDEGPGARDYLLRVALAPLAEQDD